MTVPQLRGAVSIPATTANLGPGFDAFGAALSLRATFTAVDPGDQQERVASRGDGGRDLPTGEDNLVWRSLVAACERFGWTVPDVGVVVDTPIPQARGLGSSSAAIVGGIALARVLAGADASVGAAATAATAATASAVGNADLVELAGELEGHPDNVAPAVHGGLVACATTDEGELVCRLSPAPATSRPVLLVPDTESLTAETRGALPDHLTAADAAAQAARAGHVLAGLTGAWPVDPRLAGDLLHEPARVAASADGGALLAELRGAGAHAWLSGAGPSIAVAVPARGGHPLEQVRTIVAGTSHRVLELDWDRQGIRSCIPGGCGVAGAPGCADCPLPSLR